MNHQSSRPVLKWFFRLFALLLLILLIGAGYVYWNWRLDRKPGEDQLAQVMKDLDEKEPGWRNLIDERNQKLAPADQNSAEIALKIVKELPANFHLSFEDLNMAVEAKPEINQRNSKEQIQRYQLTLTPHQQAIDQLKTLAETKPNSGFRLNVQQPNIIQIESVLLSNRFMIEHIGTVLSYESIVQIDHGKPHEAIRNCRAIVGLGRAIGDDPMLMAQLVRMKQYTTAVTSLERILGNSQPKEGLAELQSEIAAELKKEFVFDGLAGERLVLDKILAGLDSGEFSLPPTLDEETGEKKEMSFLDSMRMKKSIPEQRSIMLDHLSRFRASSKMPFPDRSEKMFELLIPIQKLKETDLILVRNLFPAVPKVCLQEQLAKRKMAFAVTALACEQFRITNGRWPKLLSEIPKTLLDQVPNDPMTGQPLLMKQSDTGIVIYGIDKNQQNKEVVGFRLFDPAKRGKPAASKSKLPIDEQENN